MSLPLTVFLVESITEDTNPWDGRDRDGIFLTLEKAKEVGERYADEGDHWVSVGSHYGGSNNGSRVVDAWQLVSEEETEDDGGYGTYIWKEIVD